MEKRIAIVGATGAVGGELLKILEERHFPCKYMKLLASARSKGKTIPFNGSELTVQELMNDSFNDVDLVFSSASRAVSTQYLPFAVQCGAVVVDNTSAFRMDKDVPLVVPEINPERIADHHGIIANPNCVAIIASMPLYPLYASFGIRRVNLTSYQAASGAGQRAMGELLEETRAYLEGRDYTRTVIPHPYAFNLFIHNTPINEFGYSGEEWKVIHEIKKIFGDSDLPINATCIRVPVLRAHGIALNIEFLQDVSPEAACRVLAQIPGVRIVDDREACYFPMPVDASGHDDVLAGRIRRDISKPNTLDIWVVGDQIRKGAALNAIQIAERL
jgi:aspartate-semialdehyde dehydrogenase